MTSEKTPTGVIALGARLNTLKARKSFLTKQILLEKAYLASVPDCVDTPATIKILTDELARVNLELLILS